MKKLLHVVASPRGGKSRTLRVANAFLERFRERHTDWLVDEINVFEDDLPGMAARQVDGKYILLGNRELYGEMREQWADIEQHIIRFKEASAYLISTPMWNFGIPYPLKQYLDILIQPSYLFRYVNGQVEGLLTGRRLVSIISSGGSYADPQTRPYDHVESYLKTIFGFVGITDQRFLKVESLDGMPTLQMQEAIKAAQVKACELAEESFD